MPVAMRTSSIETDLREIDPAQKMTSGVVRKQSRGQQRQRRSWRWRQQKRPSDKRLIKMDTSGGGGATVELAARRLESGAESCNGAERALISSETRGCAMKRLKIVSSSGPPEGSPLGPCLPATTGEEMLLLLSSIDDGANNDDDRADHGECFQFQLHPSLKDDSDTTDDATHTNVDRPNSDSTRALSSWSAPAFKRRHSSTSSFVHLLAIAPMPTTTTTTTASGAASAISSSGRQALGGGPFHRDKKADKKKWTKKAAATKISTSQRQFVVSGLLMVMLLNIYWPVAFKTAPTHVSCNEIVSTSNNISSSQSDHFSFQQDQQQQQQQQHQKLKQTNQQIRAQRSARPASSIFDSLLGVASTTEQEPSSTTTTTNIHNNNNNNHNQNDANQASQSVGSGSNNAAYDHVAYRMGQTSDKVTLPGDILLGGLFPIHMKGTKVDCGIVNRDRGIQRLEAMLYALDRINDDAELLPNIKLGAILLDSCSSSTYALNQSLEFIRASINTVESSAFECKDKSTPRPKYGSKMIAGVIGGSLSEVSLQVANLLRLFHIPQVSYASTGTALSDKTLYDLFARTVPSDMFQARAIADIVNKLGWSYVSLISSEGLYGDSGSKEFIKQASNRRICIATQVKVSPADGNSTYDQIVDNLFKRNATGVVLFTRPEDTRELLLACKRARLVRNFAWVAADGWGTHQKLVQGVEEVAWGAITVELQAKEVPGFDQYMKGLTPWGNARNPWFSEYWQEWFDCQLQANLLQQQRLASGVPYARRAAPSLTSSSSFQRQQQRKQTSSTHQPVSPGPATFDNDESYDDANDDTDLADQAARARRSPGLIQRQCGRAAAGSRSNDSSQSDSADGAQCASGLQSNRTPQTVATTTAAAATTSAGVVHRTRRRASFEMSPIDDEASRRVKQFCSPNLRISESNGYRQEQKVQFVVDAVYAMAHALHKAWSHLCGAQRGVVCEALKELNDLAGSEVKFDEHGDGLGRYNIYNYRQIQQQNLLPNKDILTVGTLPNDSITELDTSPGGGLLPDGGTVDTQLKTTDNGQQTGVEHIYTSNDGFEYSSVGKWTEDDYELRIEEIRFFQGERSKPESFCSRPCELGQAKIMRAGDHCCWICKTCQPYEYLPDEFNCQDCGIGRWPMPNKTSCYDLPQKYLRWDSVYSLISLSVSCLGIALTLFVSIIFVKYIDTPVVKASGRELSFILLAGVAFCHLATFVLLAKPTLIICGGQRFLVNFGFALMYGSLLVKTNRISRIFNCARKSAKRPSFISPKSQMLITGILVGIQIFLTIVWFIFEPPGVRADSPEGKRDEVILKCRVKGKSFILSLVYNMILITTCTVYAVKTRKIPENFNESKFIGFTMYTTIVIWLAFVTMFFGTNNSHEIQMNTMCVCISLSAYVTLFCLFSPKISIILLHPDKNVRKLTMNSATYKRAFKPVSSVASVDGRNNLPPGGGSQPDGPSGGPMSTTSNVLNLVDTQTMRLQESSIASNVVNSNSGGSNCSQKTPTTLSQQLALTGVCSNCGSHQLTAIPVVASSGHNVNISGHNVPTKDKQVAGSIVSGTKGNSGEYKPPQGTSNGAYSRQTNESEHWQTTATTSSRQYQNPGHHKNSDNINNTYYHHSHQQQQQQRKRLQSNQNDNNSFNAVASSGRPVSGSSNQIVTTNAKILHNRIATPESSASMVTTRRQINRILSEENVLADVHNDHNVTTATVDSGHTNGNKDHTIANKKRHMGSLNRLNDMTSFTSTDRHCIDESISSLVNDSFMNTSPDNTPCNVANEGHLSSSIHRHIQCKGSDSMLCNQSLQSIDYCSDCCPSLCHCSCPVCSSTNGGFENGNGAAFCSHRRNSISVARVHDDDEDMPSASGNLGDYDAVCILQLVHQGNFDAETSINGASADNRSSSIEASDETGATLVGCRQSDEVASTKGHSERVASKTSDSDQHGTSSEFVCSRSGDKNITHHNDDGTSKPSSKTRHSSQTMELQTIASKNNSTLHKNGSTKRSSNSSDTRLDRGSDYYVQTRPEASLKSTSGGSSRKRSPSTKSSSTSGQCVAGPSVAYALQAAATSALGAATSQIAKSTTLSDQQQEQHKTASCGKSVSDINLQQSLFGGSSRAVSSASSPKHRKIQSISYVDASDRVVVSGERQQDRYHVQQQQPASSSGHVVGTIQASLELVKSDEARRKSIASSKQRRKSGCFNYHDDYEYSYGLVHSNSDSEQECYFGDETDACLDIGFGLKHSGQDSLAAAGSGHRDEDLDDASYDGGGGGGYEEDNDDEDDFEHDGRVSLERHYSKRRDLKRESSLTRRNKYHHHQSSSSKRRNKELELNEHRINSVALIAATLSAGGAIMDSGSAAPTTAAATSAMSSSSLSTAAAAIKSGGGNEQIIANQPLASVSGGGGGDRYQQALKGINIDADNSSLLSDGQLHQQEGKIHNTHNN